MSSAPGAFAERFNVAEVFAPVAIGTATNAGGWVSMNNYGALHVIVSAGAATASDVSPFVVFEQATSVTGGSAKALNITQYYVKRATSLVTATAGGGTFTKRTQSATNGAPLGTTTGTVTEGTLESIGVFTFAAEDLDVTNGFDCVRATVSKTGTSAMVGSAIYIGEQPRYTPPPTQLT